MAQVSEIIKALPDRIELYPDLVSDIEKLSVDKRPVRLRKLIVSDLYFFIRYALHRFDIERPWLFDRCREVQSKSDGMLDLWAREHYKSTIITFALTIQDILRDPEITIGIFSHTRPIAKGFLKQIKTELETNSFLKTLFPDILWSDPRKESPKWSEDDGIVVKRRSNPKEATVEAWGLVDGQPTSKHYKLRVYDDVVTRESVTTPEQIKKTTDAWELSINLGAEGGAERYIGTRYHYFDTYAEIMKRGSAVPRVHLATEDGTANGKPVLITVEANEKKRRDMGIYTYSAQMLMNPTAEEAQGFKPEWMKQYRKCEPTTMNRYIHVDAASGKRKEKDNDYTSLFVIGYGQDRNRYVLDMVRDRLNLAERARLLFDMHRKWTPLNTFYEEYGMQADIQHIQDKQESTNYRFPITEVGGSMPKFDRIRRLIPLFEQGVIWFPQTMWRTNHSGRTEDLVQVFLEEEYKPFPVMRHDDMLDDLARIEDEKVKQMVVYPLPVDDTNESEFAGVGMAGGNWGDL